MATYTGTVPSGTLAAGAGLPAAWTQQVGLSLTALESAWTSYTPTLAGFTLGNGTVAGRYIQVGKLVVFEATMTFGSSSAAATASPTLTLPVTASSAGNLPSSAPVAAKFYSGSSFYQAAVVITTTTAALSIIGASGLFTNCTTTTPFTWGTGASLFVGGVYEAA